MKREQFKHNLKKVKRIKSNAREYLKDFEFNWEALKNGAIEMDDFLQAMEESAEHWEWEDRLKKEC